MPEITVKLYGTLRRFSQDTTPGLWRGVVPAGTRVIDLIELLGTKEAEVATAAVNGAAVPLETVIPEGAVVTLVTPVNGGSGS